MNNKVCTCKCCNKILGDFSIKTFCDSFKQVDKNGKKSLFCDFNCFKHYTTQFIVEMYNGRPIYGIEQNGEMRYFPYWLSNYYFTNIQSCRERMDNCTVVHTMDLFQSEFEPVSKLDK